MNDIIATHQQLASTDLSWLQSLRDHSLQQFLQQGFPTTRHEQWKYTNIERVKQHPFVIAGEAQLTAAQIQPWIIADNVAVIINGKFAKDLSRLGDLPKEVIVSGLQTALQKNNVLVKQYLNQLPQESLTNLNNAFLDDGVFVHIPAKVKLAKPLQLLYINTTNAWAQPRNIIVAEAEAQATIVESFYSIDAAITNVISQLQVEERAFINYIKIQQENLQATHFGKTTIHVAAQSEVNAYSFSTGALLARTDIEILFVGENATANLYGLYLTKDRQHVDHHTVVDHAKPHCTSHEFFRGILQDKSRAVFNGKVIVRENAKQTKASQANHNLVLSSDAEIDTKPELEIYHDDVQCTHGATVGQLDEDALFYLRSRGLTHEQAKQLLMVAFAQQVIDKITDKLLKEKLIAELTAVLS